MGEFWVSSKFSINEFLKETSFDLNVSDSALLLTIEDKTFSLVDVGFELQSHNTSLIDDTKLDFFSGLKISPEHNILIRMAVYKTSPKETSFIESLIYEHR